MARYEPSEPVEFGDRTLWREAQWLLNRHAGADPEGRCEWCGWWWPCPARRLAERAEAVAHRRDTPDPEVPDPNDYYVSHPR